MKVLAITSALLIALSSAAAITPVSTNEALKARDAEANANPAVVHWRNYHWAIRKHNSIKKRDADAEADANPGVNWRNYHWARAKHNNIKKRDADAEADANPGVHWRNYHWAIRKHNSIKKRDNEDELEVEDDDDDDYIVWPEDMTLDELKEAVDGMLEDEKAEE